MKMKEKPVQKHFFFVSPKFTGISFNKINVLHSLFIPDMNRSQLTDGTSYKGLQIFPQNLIRSKRMPHGKYSKVSFILVG